MLLIIEGVIAVAGFCIVVVLVSATSVAIKEQYKCLVDEAEVASMGKKTR